MRNVDMSNGQHLTAVQDSKDFDLRSEKLGLKNGYPLCFSLFSLWRMLKYLVLWITAGGTDLDQTKAISCRSRAWRSVQDLMWDVVETRIVVSSELSVLQELVETESAECPLGIATALAIFGAFQPIDDYLNFLEEILQDILTILPTEMLSVLLKSEFPFFGALDWLSDHKLWGSKSNVGCLDREHGEQGTVSVHSRQFQSVLRHHLDGPKGTPPLPTIAAVEFLMKQGSKERMERDKGLADSRQCFTGKGVATLTFLLTYSERFVIESSFTEEALQLLAKAEVLLREETMEPIQREEADERKERHLPPVLDRLLNPEWKASKVLHEISRKVRDAVAEQREKIDDNSEEDHQDCLILIYTFPTEEIRQDTREALGTLEEHFVSPLKLHERPKMVVFVDEATEALLDDLRPFTSLQIVPAIIPKEELTREMRSYSCQDGSNCVSGEEMPMDFHRGNVNQTQFWSPAYLRISRYTAGPLFQHPQLDSCDRFLKIDTDFFFTSPIDSSPFKKMREAGARLAWWQMHVQGQRQTGYIEAALNFLEEEDLPVRNTRFYARGRFEQKANEAGIPLSAVPAANEASTVLYGCLFGGDVQFFREPLYQSFFAYMDQQKGFENHGWSNQFFLGTAAAAFLPRSQVQRLYISGRHQECVVTVADGVNAMEGKLREQYREGNVTEFLRGADYGMAR